MKAILSTLLHHANRGNSSQHFYAVKKRVLSRYGTNVGLDVQFIEGKPCFSCDATGIHHKYYHGMWHNEQCRNCCGGWYKLPVWNLLYRIQFGEYIFHQPFNRLYKEPKWITKHGVIDGYIEHRRSKHSDSAAFILFLLFEKGYLKRWWKQEGNWWSMAWLTPRGFLQNTIHIIKNGRNAYCFDRFRSNLILNENDLPF